MPGPVPGPAGFRTVRHGRRRQATSPLLLFRSTESGLSGGSVRAQRQMRMIGPVEWNGSMPSASAMGFHIDNRHHTVELN